MRIFLITILILTFFQAKAQNKISRTDPLYLIAFEKFSISTDSMLDKLSEYSNYKRIYLEEVDFLDTIPSNLQSKKIIILNEANKDKIFKKNKDRLICLTIFPIRSLENHIEITFLLSEVYRTKKGKQSIVIIGMTNVLFKMNKGSSNFEFETVHLTGYGNW